MPDHNENRFVLIGVAVIAFAVPTVARSEPFTYVTSWYAQAEHGGFYQALAKDIYKRYGLDVVIKMGGPQVNAVQLVAAGQADCMMGSSDIQMILARANGVPIVTTAAFFQKNPSVIIAHDDVTSLAGLKGKTILISSSAHRSYWPWLKSKYGLTDDQTRPYTSSVQPFIADQNAAQQGYVTADPFVIDKAGIKNTVLLLSDYGYPAYSVTVSCMDKTLAERGADVAAFVKASAEGWKSYLADPSAGNALIKKDNPKMTDDQLAYSVGKLKETGMVDGGDAKTLGIGVITDAREQATLDFLVDAGIVAPNAVDIAKTYTTRFVKDLGVLP